MAMNLVVILQCLWYSFQEGRGAKVVTIVIFSKSSYIIVETYAKNLS